MKRLKKNLKPEKKTIETMYDSCDNGCSCSIAGCLCNPDIDAGYSNHLTQQNQLTNSFKLAAW